MTSSHCSSAVLVPRLASHRLAGGYPASRPSSPPCPSSLCLHRPLACSPTPPSPVNGSTPPPTSRSSSEGSGGAQRRGTPSPALLKSHRRAGASGDSAALSPSITCNIDPFEPAKPTRRRFPAPLKIPPAAWTTHRPLPAAAGPGAAFGHRAPPAAIHSLPIAQCAISGPGRATGSGKSRDFLPTPELSSSACQGLSFRPALSGGSWPVPPALFPS